MSAVKALSVVVPGILFASMGCAEEAGNAPNHQGSNENASSSYSSGTASYSDRLIDGGSAFAEEPSEAELVSRFPIIKPSRSVNSLSVPERLTFLAYRFREDLFEYERPLRYFAAINNPDEFEAVVGNEFDWADYKSTILDSAPQEVSGYSDQLTLSVTGALGPYNMETEEFSVLSSRQAAAFGMAEPFQLDRIGGMNAISPRVQLGSVPSPEFSRMLFGSIASQITVTLSSPIILDTINISPSDARDFVNALDSRDQYRDVRIDVKVRIESLALDESYQYIGVPLQLSIKSPDGGIVLTSFDL